MKKGKEIKLNSLQNYSIVLGSINNKQPKAVYLSISSWAEPKYNDNTNYSRVIKDLNKKIKQNLYNVISLDTNSYFVSDKTIVDLDIRESGIRYCKRSFMNCEITLFLNTEIPVNSQLIIPSVDIVLSSIINNIFEDNRTFSFYKRKK
jgi:hypothetical protein